MTLVNIFTIIIEISSGEPIIKGEENGKKKIEVAGDCSFVLYRAGEILPDENGAIAEDKIQIHKLPSQTLLNGKCDLVILNMSLANRYNEREYISIMLNAVEEAIHKITDEIKIENFYSEFGFLSRSRIF